MYSWRNNERNESQFWHLHGTIWILGDYMDLGKIYIDHIGIATNSLDEGASFGTDWFVE